MRLLLIFVTLQCWKPQPNQCQQKSPDVFSQGLAGRKNYSVVRLSANAKLFCFEGSGIMSA